MRAIFQNYETKNGTRKELEKAKETTPINFNNYLEYDTLTNIQKIDEFEPQLTKMGNYYLHETMILVSKKGEIIDTFEKTRNEDEDDIILQRFVRKRDLMKVYILRKKDLYNYYHDLNLESIGYYEIDSISMRKNMKDRDIKLDKDNETIEMLDNNYVFINIYFEGYKDNEIVDRIDFTDFLYIK